MKKHTEHLFVVGLLFVAFLLRLPSLFEPYWYGDEGIYQIIGKALRSGAFLYKDAWDNKPPLLYLIYALFNGDQFWVRLLSLIFLLCSIYLFYLLAKKLFTDTRAVWLSSTIFAILFSLPLLEGNIANAENFMLLPIVLSALLVFNYTLSPIPSTLISAGLFLSLAFLTKVVALFDFAAFFVFLAFINLPQDKNYSGQIREFAGKILPLILGFIMPILAVVLFFLVSGVFKDFIVATFSQNVGYVGAGNKLLISQGLLLVKLIALLIAVIAIFKFRKKMSKGQLLIFCWLAFAIFNAFFGGRPWTHFLLVIIPSFSLLWGLLVEEKQRRLLYGGVIAFVILLVPNNFWIYGKTLWYYQNFISFFGGTKSTSSYQTFFDQNVQRDYLLAQFLRGKLKNQDGIFIWGDNPQIYSMVGKLPPGRYSVAYHITFYPDAVAETKTALQNKKPKYIVVTKPIEHYEDLLSGYRLTFFIEGAHIYERSTSLL